MNNGDYPAVGVRKASSRQKEFAPAYVTARLPVPIYDRLVRAANEQRTSLSSFVRRLIVLQLPKD